ATTTRPPRVRTHTPAACMPPSLGHWCSRTSRCRVDCCCSPTHAQDRCHDVRTKPMHAHPAGACDRSHHASNPHQNAALGAPRVSERGHVHAAPAHQASRACPTLPLPTPTAPAYVSRPQIPYSAPHQRRVAHDQREVTCLVGTRRFTSSIVCWKSPRSPRNSRSSTPS